VPDSNPSSPAEGAFFQAVGIIQGDVTSDGDKTFVTIGEKSYGLYYASTHKMAYDALKKEILSTGITQQKLIVYPRITHYPGGKQPYRLAFQLAGFLGKEATVDGLQAFWKKRSSKSPVYGSSFRFVGCRASQCLKTSIRNGWSSSNRHPWTKK
jgi:hypothetical protein